MAPVQTDLSTGFIARLRSRNPEAWFELWETFGPVLSAQLQKWGRGRIGIETVQDLSQETMAALASAIDTHDPSRGARFSTWLLAIAKYTFGDEMDKRMAAKRGGGVRPVTLEEGWDPAEAGVAPDERYERAIFGAKVEAAIRATERESDFLAFSVFRMRVLDGKTGREVAQALRTSEPTVTRRLAQVRTALRRNLARAIATYSFTDDEKEEAERNGLSLNPTKGEDGLFDEAIAEIYRRQTELHARDDAGQPG